MSSVVDTISVNNIGNITTNLLDDHTTTGTTFDAPGPTRNEFISFAHISKNRQPGTLLGVKMKVPLNLGHANLTGLKIGVWNPDEPSETLWSFVAYTEDLISKFTQPAGTLMDIIFDTPIPGLIDGAILSIVTDVTAAVPALFETQTSLEEHPMIINRDPPPYPEPVNLFGWNAASTIFSTFRFVPMETIMGEGPNIMAFGDSISSGHPSNRSFVHIGLTGYSINLDGQWIRDVADNFTWNYQNVAISGEVMTDAIVRMSRDVIPRNPKACTIQYGAQDLGGGRTAIQMFNDMKTMVELCNTNNIIPIVIAHIPFFAFNSSQHAIRRDYNTQLESLTASHGAIVINLDERMGMVAETPPFKDDLLAIYDIGDGHLTPAGNDKLRDIVIQALTSFKEEAESVAFSDSVTALKESTDPILVNVAESVTFSDGVTAVKDTPLMVCGFTNTGFTDTGFTRCLPEGLRDVAESVAISDSVTTAKGRFIFTEIMDLGDFQVEISE